MEIIKDSKGKEYKVFNNTCYSKDVEDYLIYVLNKCITHRNTVKIYFGDKTTGITWPEEMDTIGKIGRSTGKIKIPLIVHPLSHGGPGLLDNCILKVKDMKTNHVLYQHENFIQPVIDISDSDLPEYSHNVIYNGNLHARVNTLRKAKLLRAKLS